MNPPNATYEQLHRTSPWAYGERPDRQLTDALADVEAGPAVDLGGGQGRHALYLASLGFDVELVDLSEEALGQARRTAAQLELPLRTVRSNIAFYDPPAGLQAAVAALMFHVPAEHSSLQIASRLAAALNLGGLLYLSIPGYNKQSQHLAGRLLAAAKCEGQVINHLVTRQERPRLPVPRRHETRAFGFRR